MRSICVVLFALIMALSMACASSQDRAYKAQEKIHKERLRLVDEYKKCIEKAGNDKEKVEACDQYLRAAEALK